MVKDIIIPIDEEIERFHNYILYSDRIIFSARFGDGKTFFLDHFFEKYEKEFYCIKIFPINYQVENNKDIFEYIKKDILIQLFAKNDLINDIEIDDLFFIQYYLFNNGSNIILDLLSIIPNIELPANLLQKAIGNLQKFHTSKKELTNSITDNIETYLRKFSNKEGIYEFDCISELITKCINKIKESNKKIVLLIEDLDRIDPAHIFRILNILTAHIDRINVLPDEGEYNQQNNKFNLDAIITVCDYENIKNIFHHIYGADTDFEGYIQKFTCNKPFKYSLQNLYSQHIFSCIDSPDILANKVYYMPLVKWIVNKGNKRLREIINNFNSDFSEIKMPYFEDTKIPTDNCFMKLIILCLRFGYDFNTLLNEILTNKKEVFNFCSFVGLNWLLYAPPKNRIVFPQGEILEIIINEGEITTLKGINTFNCIKDGFLPIQEVRELTLNLISKCLEYINY